MTETKSCARCKERKPLDEFSIKKSNRNRDGVPGSYCYPCERIRGRERYYAEPEKRRAAVAKHKAKLIAEGRLWESNLKWKQNNPEKSLLIAARQRAKKLGVYFNMTAADIRMVNVCPILGIPLVRHFGRSGGHPDSPSLDRIVPALGYVAGNVQVISYLANMMKSAATPDQLITFAEWVLRTFVRKAA
jgi:hypothetical protein